MTIGTTNGGNGDDDVTDAQLKADMAEYIKENYDVGNYIKSKYIELDYQVCNRRLGKNLKGAFSLIDGMRIEAWKEGNCTTWYIEEDDGEDGE